MVQSDGTPDAKDIVVQIRNDGDHTEPIGVYVDIVPPGGSANPHGDANTHRHAHALGDRDGYAHSDRDSHANRHSFGHAHLFAKPNGGIRL